MKVMLHEMSWTAAKDYFTKSDMAILQVGSNEQHGPQNPLGTDHLIAKAIELKKQPNAQEFSAYK